ncbi:hypothetical protein AM501_12245 [Aneurinibacillus migulanus]|uniref:SpoVT-AbrB domain-containing protein n=1 Tax=Aneurinibacillus migulanus TaxID=47500 RepID=A0A0D1XHR4_ANEMI|nr:AbrB/MazE/SpoVT family DNA-binding domain-containing protein [Aneurinibacillus migulanus]KIV51798.1 hypothetical protein TS65_24805 [Aneurinibacillus migulanus]KIV54501.1 hypothetical protein TS64_15805 [Aneurinibacillus migulanus]KON97917.1 hypothetical protein AF333_23285 [Aneurinibacillus migulanus]KPD08104.1 hypothetical protein AM501_12245 [Aneurinibacillus migulanus]MCP1354077.1 AbrB/MazE/SpoVT family DNA-binding domain-containing protein [Aneurinibacillus migulanus]
MKKIHISKVDGNGGVVLPKEIQKHIESGVVEVIVEDDKVILKKVAPDYGFTWNGRNPSA